MIQSCFLFVFGYFRSAHPDLVRSCEANYNDKCKTKHNDNTATKTKAKLSVKDAKTHFKQFKKFNNPVYTEQKKQKKQQQKCNDA